MQITEINLKTASSRNHTNKLQNAAYLELYIMTVLIHFFTVNRKCFCCI